MRTTSQYEFTCSYTKHFISGLLAGLSVPIKYGTCDTRPWNTSGVKEDYQTHAKYTISDYKLTRNY